MYVCMYILPSLKELDNIQGSAVHVLSQLEAHLPFEVFLTSDSRSRWGTHSRFEIPALALTNPTNEFSQL